MNTDTTVVIVGAGMAGARTAQALRNHGHAGPIRMIGAEQHAPYDRPPLSKAALADPLDTTFDIDFTELGVDLRTAVTATGLDVDRRVLTVVGADGGTEKIGYDVLVLATGATPIRLPGDGQQSGLRTREDAERLRSRLTSGAHVLLVGAGWINAEVATSALAAGCRVTCLELGPCPVSGALGEVVGSRLADLWSDVDLRCGVGATDVIDGGVITTSGERIDADTVVVGVGVRPATGWLQDCGLEINRAVVVDRHYRTSDPYVYAVGDVAARRSDRYDTTLWGEHWDEARSGPLVAASMIVEGAVDDGLVDEVPYFWSDQFGRKIQYVGHHGPDDSVVLREGPDGKWGAAWLDPGGRLRAHLSVSMPRAMASARGAIIADAVVDPRHLVDLAAPVVAR